MSRVESRRLPEHAYGQLPEAIRKVVDAARAKKGFDLLVLDLRHAGAFTDFFVICSAQNPRQITAIADSVVAAMAERQRRPANVEGYGKAEWVLLDFFDFVVHIFMPASREFYALDRLWGSADRLEPPTEHAR